ncbi:MAG: peptidoglycan DD-metalloendopeptidase family protein [Calditerrivibrio sp.]|nr:peptidoglycan DD-metalloendopeptidase family protein [Calditerrivibrio sp.]
MNKFIIYLFVFILASFFNVESSPIVLNEDVASIKKELLKEREELSKIESSKSSLLQKIAIIKKTISLNEAMLAKINDQYKLLKESQATIEKSINLLNRDIDVLVKEIRKGNIYFIDNRGIVTLKLLIFSNSYHEMVRNLEIVERVNLKMNNKVSEIVSKKNQILQLEKELSTKLKDMDNLKKIKWEVIKELQNDRDVYSQTYAMLEQDKKNKESYLEILSSRYEELNKKFQQIYQSNKESESKNSIAKGFEKYKGLLDWPVKGRIIEGYGVKYIDSIKTEIFNKGLKIEVLGDGFVRSVYEGVVKYIDWIKGYGNLIIVSHDDGYYTIYANIDDVMVKVGQKINKGEKIGIIDVDIKEMQHYLYFEIRKNNNALNPQDWLKKEAT